MKATIERLMRRSAEANSPEAGDYIGGDGLLYCGKCRTPKQTRLYVPLLRSERMPYVPCKCKTEEYERQEREAAERQRLEEAEQRRRVCFSEGRMVRWTFADCDNADDPLMAGLMRYCEQFGQMYRAGCGLILYGSVGVGKTYAAACVANELLDQGYTAMMTDFSRVINTLSGLDDKQAYLDDLNGYDLLVIDDLAAERDTAYGNEIVMSVIDSRSRSGKPLIVTTNLTAAELFGPADVRKRRIYSRLCEMCVPIEFKGSKDRRKKAMSEHMAAYKDMLGL